MRNFSTMSDYNPDEYIKTIDVSNFIFVQINIY